MTAFQRWKFYYDRGWATKEHLKLVVQYGGITPTEYEQITGEPYTATAE